MPPRAAAKTAALGKWLKEAELSEQTGFSVACLKKWRKEDRGPDYIKGDGKAGAVRYPEAWVTEWAESRRQRMTA